MALSTLDARKQALTLWSWRIFIVERSLSVQLELTVNRPGLGNVGRPGRAVLVVVTVVNVTVAVLTTEAAIAVVLLICVNRSAWYSFQSESLQNRTA